MSYTPMSDLGQQGLFDITRTLLQQPDLASLCEALSQLVKRSALADNAAIVLWQAQTQRASYYASREKDTPIKYEDETVLAHGPVYRNDYNRSPNHSGLVSTFVRLRSFLP